MIVDAHVHLWERALVDHPWLTPDAGVIDADFTTADLAPLLATSGIDAVVVVQSADSPAETAYLERVAAATPWVAGTVGWLPLLEPATCAAMLADAPHPSMVGVRHLVHTEPDPDWLVRPAVVESLGLLAAAGLTLDVPAEYPQHIGHIATIAADVPALTIVLDHLGKPPIATGLVAPWASMIRRLAEHPNVVAKVSGLNTAAGRGWDAEDLRPYVDVAVEAFGTHRLMFGSDWPVLLANGDHAQVVDATHRVLDALSGVDRERVLGANAVAIYGLGARLASGAARAIEQDPGGSG